MVGAFNSRFIHIKQHYIFRNTLSHSKAKQTIAKEIFTVFSSFLIFLQVSSSWFFKKIWLESRPDLSVSQSSGFLIKNPRPKPISYQSFSVCHWNLNNVSVHNFLKFISFTSIHYCSQIWCYMSIGDLTRFIHLTWW